MNNTLERLAYLPLAASLAAGVGGYYLPAGYIQDLILGLCTTLLGLGLGIILVNKYLSASDKRIAAIPLLKLIHPNIIRLHNDLFLEAGRSAFGKDKLESLIDILQKHKRSAQAFTPQDRDALYTHIMSMRADLIEQYDLLGDQFRELSTIIGWSFDPRIVAAALEARLQFAAFKTARYADDTSPEEKIKVIEAFFNGEAASGKVLELLIGHLGLRREEWTGG